MRALRRALAALTPLALAGCGGPQSALRPAGPEADDVATLFWVMLVGGGVIWLLVLALALYVSRHRPQPASERTARRMIVWCGVILPIVVLTALLTYALWLMPHLRPAGSDALRVEVVGEQFWWRVRYWPPGAEEPIVSANEIRVPVGTPVEFILTTNDVIHAFWIPALAGKMDMIPGRTNTLTLTAERPGIYRGACTEFCGASHAKMAIELVAMEAGAFDEWLAAEAQLAETDETEGQALFIANGCGACHTVRGTMAAGVIGPDLTHVGSRRTIAAASLQNGIEELSYFIQAPEDVKPGILMPSYAMLSEAEITAIATYLRSLE